MVFAVAADHPLALVACDVTEDMIEQYPIIVVPDSSQVFTPKTIGWLKQFSSPRRLIQMNDEQNLAGCCDSIVRASNEKL